MNEHVPQLIVMLTHNDRTVENAYEVFSECKDTKVKYWGMKEEGLPQEQMKNLYCYMKECGKTTFLEVVAYTESECLEGAEMAVACGCDVLMGTVYFDSVMKFCKEHDIKYMPFVGTVKERPSVLSGSAEKMVDEAYRCVEKGAYGIDLLGYRYIENPSELIETFVSSVNVPVCVAGSIDSYEKLDEIKKVSPWTYTIGGAFFENSFGGTIKEQIEKVCAYVSA